MELVGWRVYYADGSTVDSAAADPADVEDGVVGVVEFLSDGRRKIVDGSDWLWWDGRRWRGSATVWGGWVEPPHPEAVRGAGMEDDDWSEIRREMLADRDWPEAA